MDNFLLEHMFDWATPYPWTWFVTLKYPKEKSPKHRNFRAVNAEDAFDCWISEMLNRDGTPKLQAYFCAIERRDNGDTLFHVLLFRASNDQVLRDWLWCWFEISGGGSWERPLDNKIVGLFRYFFFRKHCDVECSTGRERTYFRALDYVRE